METRPRPYEHNEAITFPHSDGELHTAIDLEAARKVCPALGEMTLAEIGVLVELAAIGRALNPESGSVILDKRAEKKDEKQSPKTERSVGNTQSVYVAYAVAYPPERPSGGGGGRPLPPVSMLAQIHGGTDTLLKSDYGGAGRIPRDNGFWSVDVSPVPRKRSRSSRGLFKAAKRAEAPKPQKAKAPRKVMTTEEVALKKSIVITQPEVEVYEPVAADQQNVSVVNRESDVTETRKWRPVSAARDVLSPAADSIEVVDTAEVPDVDVTEEIGVVYREVSTVPSEDALFEELLQELFGTVDYEDGLSEYDELLAEQDELEELSIFEDLPVSIEDTEHAVIEIATVLERAAPEVSERARTVLKEIATLPVAVEVEDDVVCDEKVLVGDKLEELFTELLNETRVVYSPGLVRALVRLAELQYRRRASRVYDARNALPDEIGTREFLQAIHRGLSSAMVTMQWLCWIGRSILGLYKKADTPSIESATYAEAYI